MSGSSTSSSRRGRKSGSQSSDKPKQPQRGLGVAQLEKIRLHNQMEEMKLQAYAVMQSSMVGAPSSHFAHPPNMMGVGDLERSQQRFGESQAHNQPWWNPNHDTQPYGPAGVATRHFLNNIEEEGQGSRNGWYNMAGSSSENSAPGDSQDVDLELKL